MENKIQSKRKKNLLTEKSYNFSLALIRILEKINKKSLTFSIISKQIIRSATSIGANIFEAQGGRSKRDFGNFFCHALKSAHETKYWLYLLNDLNYIDGKKFKQLLFELDNISNMLGASILTLKGKEREKKILA